MAKDAGRGEATGADMASARAPLAMPHWLAIAITVAAAGLVLASVFMPAEATLLRGGAVVLLAAGLWVTGAVPEFLTALIFFFAAIVLAVAPPSVVLSGFQAGAVWLVFGGLVLGRAVSVSGLGARAVRALLARLPIRRYLSLLYAVAGSGVVLALFIPSAMGRVVMLVPIALAVADRLGFTANSNGRAGLVLAAAMGTTLPSFSILPSNVPNLVLAGAAESVYGLDFSYGAYTLLNFSVMGLLMLAAIPMAIALALPDEIGALDLSDRPAPLSAAERKLMVILPVTVALWMSDTVHGLSPAWVALGAAILCVLPRIGVMAPRAITSEINYGPWFFVAGVIGLGAVATYSGLGPLLAETLSGIAGLVPGADSANYAKLIAIGMAMSLIGTHPAAPAIMTPLAGELAEATGWPLISVLMAQVPSWAIFVFPYQVPPLLVALTLGGVAISSAVRVLMLLAIFALTVILPLHFFWGRLLGYFTAS